MKYFKTDGIRGIVNEDLNIELVQKIGKAIKKLNIKDVYLGYDPRNSNALICSALISGLLAVNINVINVGLVSTPLMQYLSRKYNLVCIMVTASHNPYYYNGIKIFKNGQKLTNEEELLIEENLDNEYLLGIGNYSNNYDLLNNYLNYLLEFKCPSKYKIIFDLSNGSLINIVNNLITKEDNIKVINNKSNGTNINLECGSLFIDKIDLKDNDYLFSFDGDGDRVLFKDNKRIYDGDLIVYILAKYYHCDKVVLTNNVNVGLLKAFKKSNIKVYISDVGDKNVYDLMIKENCLLGGETSGHIINSKYMTSGDGLLNALIIIKILNEINIDEYLKDVVYYHELSMNLINDYSLDKLNNLKDKYQKLALMNIRRSGTENVIRVKVMSKYKYIINKIKKEILNNE